MGGIKLKIRAPERFIWLLLAAGFGLGLVGAVLTAVLHRQADNRPCRPAGVTGPDCGTPQVVRYTWEEEAPPVPAGAAQEAPPAGDAPLPEPIKPLLPVTPVPGRGLVQQIKQAAAPPAGENRPGSMTAALAGVYPQAGELATVSPTSKKTEPAGRLGDQITGTLPAAAAAAVPEVQPAKAEVLPAAAPMEAAKTAPAEAKLLPSCPAVPGAPFDLIPIEGAGADHPDRLHGDLSLGLRGYAAVAEPPGLVDYNGPADPGAPQLAGLFGGRAVEITTVYRANHWLWDAGLCSGQAHGCSGGVIEDWPVTAVGLATTAGEAVYPPSRGAEIYGGGYIALVLYAETNRLTLGYTRRDSVAAGYVVHLEKICVDPHLLALYRAQVDPGGWRSSGHLPAVRGQQAVGTALGGELVVAVRDGGNFLDPRSRKDWWQGY